MIKFLPLIFILTFLFSGCSAQPTVLANFEQSVKTTPIPTTTQTYNPKPTATIIRTNTAVPSLTETSTPLPSETPMADLHWNPAGKVLAPILLYHHVADITPPDRYYIPPVTFKTQMELLKAKGYHTISISLLVEALDHGAFLPPHPIVITFDDGAADIYQNAFPIMKNMGFTGTFYVPGKYLGGVSMIDADQGKEMIAAGWEFGSHGMTHTDLNKSKDLSRELIDSRNVLEEELEAPINTFAYPFGYMSEAIIKKVKVMAGYNAAVGLGVFSEHVPFSEFYLSRIEIQHGTTFVDFEKKITFLKLRDGKVINYLLFP
jgi:peptidoglycan/xylan/chitin deacetylase (PgdA/CDA1 family)